MAYSIGLAHLSDLHFGDKSRFQNKNPTNLGKECAQAIRESVQGNWGFNLEKQPFLVIVTGDITEKAGENEFDQAGRFFASLRDSLEIPAFNFVFLPGNHDVSRSACETYFGKGDDKSREGYDAVLETKKIFNYSNFRKRFYGGDNCYVKNLTRGAELYDFGSLGLCVAGINSCEQIDDQRHLGLVSEEQAEDAMDTLAAYSDKIKIVALHHAVNSDIEKLRPWISYLRNQCKLGSIDEKVLERLENDALNVRGGDYLRRILQDRHVHLLLHGHQHSYDGPKPERWTELETYCQIYPAGSFGLKPNNLPKDQPNCLQLYFFYEDDSRLYLKSSTLEYDPNESLNGVVGKGRFRDIGKNFVSSYPVIPRPKQDEKLPSVESKDCPVYLKEQITEIPNSPELPSLEVADCTVYVKEQIEEILNDPDKKGLCAAFFILLDEESQKELLDKGKQEEPAAIAEILIENGFAGTWFKIEGRLKHFSDFFDELQKILLLLVQTTVKPEAINKVRPYFVANKRINVFESDIQYGLMAEVVLKTVLEREIDITLKNQVTLLETGIDHSRRVDALVERMASKLSIPDNEPREKLRERVEQQLKAQYMSKEPFFFINQFQDPVSFPYLVEFYRPKSEPPENAQCIRYEEEDFLYRLINILLEKLAKRPASIKNDH